MSWWSEPHYNERKTMKFNRGKPYHGSSKIDNGNLTGATDTDYFYFFCPQCAPRHIMRVLEYGVHADEPNSDRHPDLRPKPARDFVIVFKLHCNCCKLTDFVKVGNMGWQGGELPLQQDGPN
jgi:hypothetical protein